MAFVGVMTVGAFGLPVLIGYIFWAEVVLQRPSSPASRALVLVILATLLGGFSVVRFVGASASRRPRWQRVHGVMLLVLAACFLFQGTRSCSF
jgi:hypothetical protein